MGLNVVEWFSILLNMCIHADGQQLNLFRSPISKLDTKSRMQDDNRMTLKKKNKNKNFTITEDLKDFKSSYQLDWAYQLLSWVYFKSNIFYFTIVSTGLLKDSLKHFSALCQRSQQS